MSLAERKAAEITRRTEQEDIRRQLALRSAQISDTASPGMWDALVKAIEEEVREFASRIPAAESLRIDLPNQNNLTISTTLTPLHSLVLVRTPVGVQATLTPFPHRSFVVRSRKKNLPPIFFSTDGERPCFSDGDRSMSLDMAVEHFLEPLFDLF